VEVDPLASMRCWAIEITLGGRTFDVPALTAVDWWPVLSSGDPSSVLDIIESTEDDLDELLLTGAITGEEINQALVDVIEEAAGRSRHVSMILVKVAEMYWDSINGALARRGFRWEGQPLGAALDAIYAEVTGRPGEREPDQRQAERAPAGQANRRVRVDGRTQAYERGCSHRRAVR
jgi:hypothetical protein